MKKQKILMTIPMILLLGTFFSCKKPSRPESPRDRPGAEIMEVPSKKMTLLIFGDSITAGYGLSSQQAFPHFIGEKIGGMGWNFDVVTAGLSGDTTTSGLGRIDWVLKRKTDVLVLELGANDGLRGIPPEVSEKNLQKIIDAAKFKYPTIKIILCGMKLPPNYGPKYTERFEKIYPRLAEKNKVALVPFILEGVGGIPSLNQPDGIHPTVDGHKIIADTLWHHLMPILTALVEGPSL